MGRRTVVGLAGGGSVVMALWLLLVVLSPPSTPDPRRDVEVAGATVTSVRSTDATGDGSSSTSTSASVPSTTFPPSSTTTIVTVSGAEVFGVDRDPACAVPDRAVLWEVAGSAALGDPRPIGDGAQVSFVEYPLPDHEGRPWSTWGQGIVVDGVYLSAVGDHRGREGRSYLYRYDADEGRLDRVADLAAVAGLQSGAWGYGKVHAPMVADPCGRVLAASYWGSRKDIEFGRGYDGDVLFVIDAAGEAVGSLGTVLPGHGVPSMAAGPSGLLYVEAVDPLADGGPFVVLDPTTMTVVARWDEPHGGFRSVLVDGEGRGHATAEPGRAVRFDPGSGTFAITPLPFGADRLRAAFPPGVDGPVATDGPVGPDEPAGTDGPVGGDGTAYGVTEGPTRVFSLDVDGVVGDLGPLDGYTTSLARSVDGRFLFAVPGAHGGAYDLGVPVVVIDTETGRREELSLRAAGERAGFRLGGTYSVVAGDEPDRVYITFNAAPMGADPGDRFGTVVLAVVELGR